MSVNLDIILSIIFGSLVLLMIAAFNMDLVENSGQNSMSLAVQKTGFDFQEILRRDLRNAGFRVPGASGKIVLADSTQIKFKVDLGMDGSVNEVHYYLDDVSSAAFTGNPNDRILYRKIDSQPPEVFSIGLREMVYQFINSQGIETLITDSIRQVGYRAWLESTESYDGTYAGIEIRDRINLKNLK